MEADARAHADDEIADDEGDDLDSVDRDASRNQKILATEPAGENR